jgi:uncharacterized protein YndB with AHSA1/START domain
VSANPTPRDERAPTTRVDVAAGVVHAAVEIDAAPERVFRSLTTPEELAAWWGSDDSYRTERWTVDLCPGGRWHCHAVSAEGHRSTVGGEYLVVDPPRLLEYTWEPSWEDFHRTRIRVELAPNGRGGTLVTVTHLGFTDRLPSAEGHGQGWVRVLEWVRAHAEA